MLCQYRAEYVLAHADDCSAVMHFLVCVWLHQNKTAKQDALQNSIFQKG